MSKNKEFDPNQVFFMEEDNSPNIGDPADHEPAYKKHNIKPVDAPFYR